MDRPTLLLIDGHSIAYRAFFALPTDNFATSTGQHTNGVYGFTSMLINLLRDADPTHVAVAFDVSRTSFRTAEYPEYKSTRDETPAPFRGQVELIKDVLDALRIVHVDKDGYEADDIVATLSWDGAQAGMDVLVCTGDRDAIQLVDERVTLLYPIKGVSELQRLDPEAVEAKYLVAPKRYPELAALVGETSDNLPGVPGVGPITAAKWLTQYDGLENLLLRADQVPGKAGESLRAHLDDVRRNRRLNALVRDLDLTVTVEDLRREPWDREQVHEIFDRLEFRSLRQRLLETLPQHDEPAAAAAVVTGEHLQPGELGAWLTAHGGDLTGVDMQAAWSMGEGDVEGVGLAAADGQAAWFAPDQLTPEDEQAWIEWLGAVGRPKAMHAASKQILAAGERGWQVSGVVADTELQAYLLRPDQRSYGLDDLVMRSLKREVHSETSVDGSQATLDFGDAAERLAQPAMERAAAIRDLARSLDAELDESGRRLLSEVELPLQQTLARMQRTGIAVDTARLRQLRDEYDARVLQAEQQAYEALGHPINLGSPKQLQVALFDELDMPKTRKIKSGYTTDADSLKQLFEKTAHPFLANLLMHRDQIRLRQTVDGLLKSVAADGRIHTTYEQTVAATGRLSSTDPNLQNIPIRTEHGRQIRAGFVAGDGFESLMSADYSQIEMRVMAHVSGDADLIEAFKSGTDFHTVTASKVFGVEPTAVSGEQRAKIKAMNYGLAYGLSAYGLSGQLGISVGEAKALMEDYFAIFGGVQDFLHGLVVQATKTGYTETMLGRRRYLPDLASSSRQRREMAERMALNAPIQGSAADIIKVAMLNVEQALVDAHLTSRMLLQVHDELVLEVAPGEQGAVEALVREQMGHAVELDVPLDVSVGVGANWQLAAH